ncbi:23246_t:CDS:1 [Rhizophagus irregularis]|nr:23246_t:CDS:1 [Rhizophagus irregularis]
MNPEAKPPPVISSVVPPLELSGVFMLPPDESSVSPPLQLMDLMKNTSLIPDVSYPVIPSNPLPDVIPLPSQFQSTETDFFMENTAIYDQYAEYFRLKNYENTVDYFDYSNYANNFL